RLAIAEQAHDLEHIGPGGEVGVVCLLEGVDGHQEEELLVGEFALFSAAVEVAEAPAGAAAAFEAGGCVIVQQPSVDAEAAVGDSAGAGRWRRDCAALDGPAPWLSGGAGSGGGGGRLVRRSAFR